MLRSASIFSFILSGLSVLAVGAAFIFLVWKPGDTPEIGAEVVTGPAELVDGDSLMVGGVEIRLAGIDAPEFKQTCVRQGKEFRCGRTARGHLAGLIGARLVTCRIIGTDRFDRALGECRVGQTGINEQMVSDGWAVAYRRYHEAERRARVARRGLWAGSFQLPAKWREENL